MLFIPFIDIADGSDASLIAQSMQKLVSHNVSNVNWPSSHPSVPKVQFKIGHNGTYLYIHFFVEENEVLAKTTEDNGPVWTDSCVEFFVSFGDSPYYYNAEFSCIGKALLGYRKDKKDSVHASQQVMGSIDRYSSLGNQPFGKKQGRFEWDMLVVIPASAYWNSGLTSFSGIKAKGNVYKCGDDLSEPHYLSWNPVLTENPNFHTPNYFGELVFE